MGQTLKAKQVKQALYRKGTTLSGWCRENNFNYRTALNAVNRHTDGRAREPWGPVTRAILTRLSIDIGKPLLPDMAATEVHGAQQ